MIRNTDQADNDDDTLQPDASTPGGDACDPDDDNDGVPDNGDLDSNVVGDNICGDGVTSNCDDNCQFTPNATQANSDAPDDNFGDACDNDDDADDLSDADEVTAGTDPLNPDTDGDGLKDGNDACPAQDGGSLDLDGDGCPPAP